MSRCVGLPGHDHAVRELLVVALVMLVAGVAATWPLATDLAELSVSGPANNDVYLNEYLIFWGAHALAHEPTQLYHPNMFWPARYTFAYADMLLSSSLLMSPVIALTHDPTLTYNLLLLASIVIGGLGLYQLSRLYWSARWVGVAGALIYAFNALHFSRYRQPQLFTDHWLPWMLWALLLWLQSTGAWRRPATADPRVAAPQPGWRWPTLTAVLFCLHALTGSHNAVFGAMLGAAIAVYTLTLAWWAARPVAWKRLAAQSALFGLLVIVVLAPVFYPYWVEGQRLLEQRISSGTEQRQVLEAGSAHLAELVASGARWYRWLDRETGWPSAYIAGFERRGGDLFPGVVVLLLGIAATMVDVSPRRPTVRRAGAMCLDGVGLCALGLAVYALVRGAPWTAALGLDQPVWFSSALVLAGVASGSFAGRAIWLRDEPHAVRTLATALVRRARRQPDLTFWSLFALACLLLALGPAAGLYRLLQPLPGVQLIRVPRRFLLPGAFALSLLSMWGLVAVARWSGRARVPVIAALLVAFAVESNFAPLPVAPEPYRCEPVHQWLAQQPGEFAIVEIPIDNNPTAATRQMLQSTCHWKKLLIGYSGATPPGYEERMRRLALGFPGDAALNELVSLGVRYAIAIDSKLSAPARAAIDHTRRLQSVRRFPGLVVYRIIP